MTDIKNCTDSDELAQRKQDHITLAMKSQTPADMVDARFNYEPLFFSHPTSDELWPCTFLGKVLSYPVWISSMTGGTEHANKINENLARLCGEFKLGMGLGSCRALLHNHQRLPEFAVRKFLGTQPFFANLGLAQLEELVMKGEEVRIHEMIKVLEADGLIIHLNPLQEWFQPGGDRYQTSPLITITRFLEKTTYPVLIKEVGQGMGPKSLKALLELPIAGIEFGAFGGTNFSLLESLRGEKNNHQMPFISVGHTAGEMVEFLNAFSSHGKEFIISGGIKNVLDGYELKSKLNSNSLIGMAQAFLAPAKESYESLKSYFTQYSEALLTAKKILSLKGDQ